VARFVADSGTTKWERMVFGLLDYI